MAGKETDGPIRLEQETAGTLIAGQIAVVQYWSGFHRGRSGLVVSIDGRVSQQRAGSARQVQEWFRAHCFGLVTRLTEQQARDRLAQLGVSPGDCCGCGMRLPIGGMWCAECGAKQPQRLVTDPVPAAMNVAAGLIQPEGALSVSI